MGSRGDAYDNAVAESFFATLKKELIRRRSWPTRRELHRRGLRVHRSVLQPDPRHSTLGYLSPVDYENSTLVADRAKPRRFAAQGSQ